MKYLLVLIVGLTTFAMVSYLQQAHASGYRVTNNYDVTVNNNFTTENNYSGISDKDLATIGAMTGAAAGLQFSPLTPRLQWGAAFSCLDSDSDDCGGALGLSKRNGNHMFTGILSGASDERQITIGIWGEFE